MSSLNRVFGQLFNPARIVKEDEEEDVRVAARGLSDIIGTEAVSAVESGMPGGDATSIADLQAPDTPGTGMYEDADREMVTQLSQIQGMLQSDNPILEAMGMKEYGEFIKPPPAPEPSTGNWRDYIKTTNQPTKVGFNQWLLQQNRSRSGVNWKDDTHPDPALAKQFEYVLDGKPLTNETPAQIKELNKKGVIRYRPDSKAVDLYRQGLGVHTSMDAINAMMRDIIPQLKTMPDGLSPMQKGLWRLQSWATGAVDIHLTQGIMRQYSTQSPLIAKLLTRNVFQDKGAGSDKDFDLAQDFLPVLPGQVAGNIGDDPASMELKLEAINYIIDTLYPRNLSDTESMTHRVPDWNKFHAKVKAYHDELMTIQGKEIKSDEELRPPAGTKFMVRNPENGEMVEMVITEDDKLVRVE